MQRSKALIASALVAASLTVGAGIYVAGSGLLAGATDNVGNLQPTVATTATAPSAPQEITVYVDPVTGTATTVAPQAAPVEPSPTDATPPAEVSIDRSGEDRSGEDRSGEDRSGDDRHDDDHGSEHEREDRSDDDD